jgi:hypothetical protein
VAAVVVTAAVLAEHSTSSPFAAFPPLEVPPVFPPLPDLVLESCLTVVAGTGLEVGGSTGSGGGGSCRPTGSMDTGPGLVASRGGSREGACEGGSGAHSGTHCLGYGRGSGGTRGGLNMGMSTCKVDVGVSSASVAAGGSGCGVCFALGADGRT